MPMSQIDPAIYDSILTGGAQIGQLDPQIAYQQALAQQIRQQTMMPNMPYMSGRRASAPNPLEYLSHAYGQYTAGSQDRSTMALQQEQARIRAAQNQQVVDAYRQMMGQGQQQPQSPQGSALSGFE
jgi:hypothetical protein